MKAFNDTEKQFLANYRPADEHFTSSEEIEQVAKALNLKEMANEQLHDTRDAVVKLYDEKLDAEFVDGKRTENFWGVMSAMQSVVAVIDSVMYNV